MNHQKKPLLSLPCKMKLNDLEAREKGYHCSNCDKVLTDFRGKSNEEVLHTIRTSEEKICGIFQPHQFGFKTSQFVLPATRRVGLSLLGMLGFLGPVVTACSDQPAASTEPESKEIKQKAFNRLKFPMNIEGVLQDEKTKKPLPFAEVAIYQDGKRIRSDETDANGQFRIVLGEGDLVRESFDFILSKSDYKTDTLKSWAMGKDAVGQKIRLTMRAETGSCVKTVNGSYPEIQGEPTVEGEVYYEERPLAGVPIMEEPEPQKEVEEPKKPM